MWRHGGALAQGLVPLILIPLAGWVVFFWSYCGVCVASLFAVAMLDGQSITENLRIIREKKRAEESTATGGGHTVESVVLARTPTRELLSRFAIWGLLAVVTLFHFGNATMLPSIGMEIDVLNEERLAKNASLIELPYLGPLEATLGTSSGQVVAEVTSLGAAALAGKLANSAGWGRRRVMLIGLCILPVRGVLQGATDQPLILILLQILDGIAGAIIGVVGIMMMQDAGSGTGRSIMLQGLLAAALGCGTTMSQITAGEIEQRYSVDLVRLGRDLPHTQRPIAS